MRFSTTETCKVNVRRRVTLKFSSEELSVPIFNFMKTERRSRLFGNVVPTYPAGKEKSAVKCKPVPW
jgi:hypothetical protein